MDLMYVLDKYDVSTYAVPMKSDGVPSNEQHSDMLRAWAENLDKEAAEIAAAISTLQQRLSAVTEKRDLLSRLMDLSAGTPGEQGRGTDPKPPTRRRAAAPAVEDRIEEMLRSSGAPMHIRDIRASLISMGTPLPGKGAEANIILRLRRDPSRFVRTGRGTYGLVAWQVAEYSPQPRTRRVRRRKAAKP